jgi:pimeloyl-ACP methyl ester carboxylesterase
MLHGWGDVSASWQFVVDALRHDWQVIAPDWRGFGLSQSNNDIYWFPEYLADLDGLLEHYSPGQPVNLVGHSMGGNIGGLYAGIRPERVAHFVNIEGTGLPRHAPEEAPERYSQWLQQLRGEAPSFRNYRDRASFAQRLRNENPRLSEERAAWISDHYVVDDAAGDVHLNFDPYHRVTNPILYRVEEALACWRRVTAEVLFVAGRDSFFFKQFYPLESPEFRERVTAYQNLRREVLLDDCGHNIHHDQPEQLAQLIEDFIPR